MNTSVADRAYALLHEEEERASGVRVARQYRIGKAAYMALIEEVAGVPNAHLLDDIDPRFGVIADGADRDREQRLQEMRDAWGKDGGHLWGLPLVCDEDFEGIALEPVGESEQGATG